MAREARPRYLSLVGLALAIAATGQARRGPFVRHDTCARAIASATNEYQKLDQNNASGCTDLPLQPRGGFAQFQR
jgi:hypothetical protein